MRLNGIVYPTAPYRYVHVCSNEECGYKIDYQCQYPYIKYVTREEADKLTPKLSDIVGITENSPSLIFRALEWGKHKYRDVEYDYATVYCDRDRKRDGTESLEGQTVIIDDRVCEVVRMHTHAMATPIRRDDRHPSFNTAMAEFLGNVKPLPRLTTKQFSRIVCLFEDKRDVMERMLERYDDQDCGWRQYYFGACDEDWFPADLMRKVRNMITTISKGGQKPMEFDGNGWELLWLALKVHRTTREASRIFAGCGHYGKHRPASPTNSMIRVYGAGKLVVVSRRYQISALKSIRMWKVDGPSWIPLVQDILDSSREARKEKRRVIREYKEEYNTLINRLFREGAPLAVVQAEVREMGTRYPFIPDITNL
ncbi:unnamed protein product [Sphagnum balticum]